MQAQHDLERRQPRLVQTQGAFERFAVDPRNQPGTPDHRAGLRTARQLVAGEADKIGAGTQAVLRPGLGRQAPAVREAVPGAKDVRRFRSKARMDDAGASCINPGLDLCTDCH